MAQLRKFDTEKFRAMTQEIVEEELGRQPDSYTGNADVYVCPLLQHKDDSSPSFTVYPDNIRCYGCGWGGDVIAFIQEFLNMGKGSEAFVRAGHYINDKYVKDGVTFEENYAEKYKAKREASMRAKSEARAKARDLFAQQREWERYIQVHDAWTEAGIPPDWQQYWKLGYKADHVYKVKDDYHHSPALTIPIATWANGTPAKFVTMQFRLLAPVEKGGKYRFYRTEEVDPGSQGWVAYPNRKPEDDQICFVLEGMKKGGRSAIEFRRSKLNHIQVATVPSKSDLGGLIPFLKKFKRVYFWWDPDVADRPKAAGPDWSPLDVRACEQTGKHAYYVRTGMKVDDQINEYGTNGIELLRIAEANARRP